MGFYDKINQITRNAASKSREVAEITKQNMEISANEQKIKELAVKLGLTVADRNLLNDDPQLSELISQIKGLQASIERSKQTIQEIRNLNICPNCGAEVSRTSRFCEKCGSPISRDVLETASQDVVEVCPSCGEKLEPNAKFCTNCGTKISD